jgi:signal transduction histidine kinase
MNDEDKTKDEHRGFGLGLYIVKNFIEGHGSHVILKSAPDEGTCFSFTLKKGSPIKRR